MTKTSMPRTDSSDLYLDLTIAEARYIRLSHLRPEVRANAFRKYPVRIPT